MSSLIGIVVGACVVYGCVRILDREHNNAPAWLVLAGAVWAVVQSTIELARYLLS